MDARTTRRRRTSALVAVVPWLAFALAALAWWAWLAPAQVGGRATYVLVSGTSMQPLLHTGDLVIARDEKPYAVGDLVVLQLANGNVIHRIIGGDAATGWTTRGDHNNWTDPWVLRDDQVLGRAWLTVPGAGDALTWVSVHPIATGAVVALLGVLPYLPWRRRRVTPQLAELLAHSRPVPRPHPETRSETSVLAVSAASTIAAMALVVALGVRHELVTSRGLLALVALGWAAVCTSWLAGRRYDGHGLPEPLRSQVALSGKVREVDALPELQAVAVHDAAALRTLADRARLPVLECEDDGPTYLLLTAGRGAFVWRPTGMSTLPSRFSVSSRLTVGLNVRSGTLPGRDSG